MKKPVLFIVVILSFSCSSYQQSESSQVLTTDTSSKAIDSEIQAAVDSTLDEDCVFNNDIKGLTMDWVDEIKDAGFVWRAEKNMAFKVVGNDTIKLWKGGCNHFSIHAEWSGSDTHDTSDSTYWITKALKLAEEYQMKDYVAFIHEGRLKRDRSSEIFVVYDVMDTAQYTNTYYEGIVIGDDGQRKMLSLSSYYN